MQQKQYSYLIYFYEFNINPNTSEELKKSLFLSFLDKSGLISKDQVEILDEDYQIDDKICIFPLYLFLGLARKNAPYSKQFKMFSKFHDEFIPLQRAITCYLQYGFFKEARYELINKFMPYMINTSNGVETLYQWLTEDNLGDFNEKNDIQKIIESLNDVFPTRKNEISTTLMLLNSLRAESQINIKIPEGYDKQLIQVLDTFTKALIHDKSIENSNYVFVLKIFASNEPFLHFDILPKKKQNNKEADDVSLITLMDHSFKRMVLSAFLLNNISITTDGMDQLKDKPYLPKDLYYDAMARQRNQ